MTDNVMPLSRCKFAATLLYIPTVTGAIVGHFDVSAGWMIFAAGVIQVALCLLDPYIKEPR